MHLNVQMELASNCLENVMAKKIALMALMNHLQFVEQGLQQRWRNHGGHAFQDL